jgi:hypothetical protein
MIKFTINKKNELDVGQWAISPTVYLDHWALRKFSEDQMLATRLTVALQSRNGTLALSLLNLAEFSKVTMGEQAHKAEELVEAILPRVFFLEIEPFAVISRENELLAGGPPAPPHADLDLLRTFPQLKPTSLHLFTARDLFKAMQNNQLAERLDSLADTVVERVEALRDTLDTDEVFRSIIRRPPYGPQIQQGTRVVLRELVRSLLIDKRTKITRNHGIDLLHAVVPVAYCDLVLLDKHWETQVDRVRSRLNDAGISVPIGRVFSGKANGVDRFLCELESS